MKRLAIIGLATFILLFYFPAAAGATTRILVIPGHEPTSGGASFRDTHERDLALELSILIADELIHDGKFDAIISRDASLWLPELADHFVARKEDILSFKRRHQFWERFLYIIGLRPKGDRGDAHTEVSDETAIHLYGTNLWANENDIDLVLSVHFNDDFRKADQPGRSRGFTVFIPGDGLHNASTSLAIGRSLYAELKKVIPVTISDKVREGIFPSNSLIALGAYNTLDASSVLVEYGFVYEPQFQSERSRAYAFEVMAKATVAGILEHYSKYNEKR
mgnify:CR=1 FL=1